MLWEGIADYITEHNHRFMTGCASLHLKSIKEINEIYSMLKIKRVVSDRGVVFLLGDFWRPSFPPATLFGRTMRCPGGAAALAFENKTPVIPFYGFREQFFQHRLVFGSPVFLHEEYKAHQRAEATNKLNLFLEQVINSVPEQWFYWFNVNERWEYESVPL